MKKQFLILFAFISVLALSQVPQRFNKVIVTGDITSPKFIKTGSNADSVLLGNGSARAISTIKTDTVSLSNRINAKATGNGTANGTNTGDETLTSIKTKLGAATSGSDGYLKYQDWSIFNSKEPAIIKNSGFNLPLGNIPGTVLEGRTFGTAANSAVEDFAMSSTVYGSDLNSLTSTSLSGYSNSTGALNRPSDNDGYITTINFDNGATPRMYATQHVIDSYGDSYTRLSLNSTATSWSEWRKMYDSSNLTSSLTTNYIPKWNGSSFVNATAGTDYQLPITLTTNGTSGAATFSGNVLNVPNYDVSGGVNQTQTTVNGSTSGYIVCSMPFKTASYKKVVVYLNALTGNVTYTFPVQFLRAPQTNTGNAGIAPVTYTATATSLTLIGGTNTIGWITLEGY